MGVIPRIHPQDFFRMMIIFTADLYIKVVLDLMGQIHVDQAWAFTI